MVGNLGERGEIEIVAHERNEPRSRLRIERLEQRAEIGLVQIARERDEFRASAQRDGSFHRGDEFGRNARLTVTNAGRALPPRFRHACPILRPLPS